MFLTDLEDVDLLDRTKSLPWYSKILYLAYSNNFSTSAISINYRKKKKNKTNQKPKSFWAQDAAKTCREKEKPNTILLLHVKLLYYENVYENVFSYVYENTVLATEKQ